MKYNEFIENKRVIFVGACPNLVGKKHGEFIDSYDVVVKTNGSMLLKGNYYYRDYGKKLDVLYTNIQFYRETKKALFRLSKMGVKYLRMKGCSDMMLSRLRKTINTHTIREAIQKVNKTVKTALMGCYILQDILDRNPKELYLTGIDFFVSKKRVFEKNVFREYLSGYLTDRIMEQGSRISIGKTEDAHSQLSNTKFIYDLFMKGKIKMPDFIEELMLKIVKSGGYTYG